MDFVYFIQKNSLDRRKRTLRIEAHNESFSSKIIINEHCYYSVSTLSKYPIPALIVSLVELQLLFQLTVTACVIREV